MKTVLWLLAVISIAEGSPAHSADTPTPEELLAAYQTSVEKLARAQIEHVETFPERVREQRLLGGLKKEDAPTVKSVSLAETNERLILRDGPRWNITNDIRVTNVSDGTPDESSRRIEAVFSDQILISNQSGAGGLVVSAWLDAHRALKAVPDGSRPDPNRQLGNVLGGARILFGWVRGDASQPIWQVMRDATTLELKPTTERVAGVETYVLKSVGIYGAHTLWLDQKCGGLARKIEVRKQLGNLYDDIQIGALAGQSGDAPRRIVTAPSGVKSMIQAPDLREVFLRMDNVSLDAHGDAFVMTKWNFEENTESGNARVERRVRSENSIRSVEFIPEAVKPETFRLRSVIPDKTRVMVMDGDAGARYEWIGGEVKERTGK